MSIIIITSSYRNIIKINIISYSYNIFFLLQVLNLLLVIMFSLVFLFWILQICRFGLLLAIMHYNSNSTSADSKFSYGFDLLGQILYCMEYITLIFGICKFQRYFKVRAQGSEGINKIKDIMKYFTEQKCCIKFLIVSLIIILLPMHFVVTIFPPIFQISWNEINSHSLPKGFACLEVFAHFYNFLTRTAIAFVTLFVIFAWKNAEAEIFQEQMNATTTEKMSKLIKQYNETGELVNAFQNIFQAWFVLKWIVYFIDITADSIHAAEVIFKNTIILDDLHQLGYALPHLIYEIFSIFYLFIFGSLMNYYHKKYRKTQYKQQKEYLSCSEQECFKLIQSSHILIPENLEYQFLPSLFFIDFPLNSPGYILTMLLALFAFVTSCITT